MNNKKKFRFSFTHLYIGTVISLVCLLGIAAFGFNSLQETNLSSEKVIHTFSVINELNSLQTKITQVSTGQRGFIITGQKRYVENFDTQVKEIRDQISKLSQLTNDNSVQQRTVGKLDTYLKDWIIFLEDNIELVQQGKKDKAIDKVKSGYGQDLNDKIIAAIKEMNLAEEKLLQVRLLKERELSYFTGVVILVGSLLTFFIVLLAILLIRTELKQRIKAQNKYYQSSQIQNAMLQGAGFALIATDINGKINLFNPAAEKLLGYTQEEMIGQDPSSFHLYKEIAYEAQDLSTRFNTKVMPGFGVFTFLPNLGVMEGKQWTYVKKNGSHVPVILTITALRDRNDEITGYFGIAFDVSERLEFETAIIEARELALAGNKAKSEFLANMSHEIRTPMNAIMGMAQLLQETKLDEEQRKYVEIFQHAGESLLSLINDVLDISKIEAGHFELDKSPFRLTSVVSKAVEIMALKAHQNSLELAVDIDHALPDYFVGDGNRIRQIILNLLGNAIKFTKRGEVLLKIFSSDMSDGLMEITIEVHDTGIGMTPDQVNKLFERFTQADTSITKEFGGTGLGLSITKKLSELMGGSIKVESTEGIGSKFIVKFQIQLDTLPDDEEVPVIIKGLRILVIDDTRTNRLILKKMLENQQALVTEADSGKAAIRIMEEEKARNKSFDLVLIDCRMPETDGFKVAQMIQETLHLQGPLLMMLTSDNRPGDLAKSRDLGLKSFLIKPILKNELMEAISKAINHKDDVVPKEIKVEKTNQSRPLRILLVDDNDDNRIVVKSFLKSYPWTIDEAKNGKEALELFKHETYDIILMDMQMPIMDGYTATSEIRKLEASKSLLMTPIFAITAYAMKEEMDKSIEAGCNGQLTKPIAKTKLVELIETYTQDFTVDVLPELADIVPDYIERRKEELSVIQKAIQEKDSKLIQSLGHKLLGTAGSYGFPQLSEIGRMFEDGGKVADFIVIAKALKEYQHYLQKLKIT